MRTSPEVPVLAGCVCRGKENISATLKSSTSAHLLISHVGCPPYLFFSTSSAVKCPVNSVVL
uniref:Uncharacterized protein n=1 Tax=Anguilla anguilla TaxID=7936 RepID=A0A0E9RVK9_ANGAN